GLVVGVYESERCVSCGIGVFVRGGAVGGYGYVSHFYITGELPNLYHHGETSHLILALNGLGVYSGFYHDTSSTSQ
ncbi:hypothetical protein KIP88_44385, partial [Bradyrhizobium sp. SRL28]|uniref:hypothetical protein n=1 Tax=Bradyrhizobium sp. SRL28 TaxID=2836178 RepID=UPI001BDEF17E